MTSRDSRDGRTDSARAIPIRENGGWDGVRGGYQEYAESRELALAPVMWERYLTDPNQEPDPGKHLTQIVWPLV